MFYVDTLCEEAKREKEKGMSANAVRSLPGSISPPITHYPLPIALL